MRKFTTVLSILAVAFAASAQEVKDIFPDTWVASDALGRLAPTSSECPLKTDRDRTVGIFYITWHTQGLHDGKPYRADVTKVLDADTLASRNGDSPAWTTASYHWGEPEYGYFLSADEYVIRHDMSMLADAAVDVVIFDVTNAVMYWDEWSEILRVMSRMKAEGNKVPQFCFWAFNGPVISVVTELYERFYRNPQYRDLWFIWDGKPLLLYNSTPSVDANPGGGQKDLADYPAEIKEFFTLRNMWWGYYEWAGKRHVGTEDNWSFGLDLGDSRVAALTPQQLASRHEGRFEEFPVTPAQHPISVIGKSWSRNRGEPELDIRDMPQRAYVPYLDSVVENPVRYGIYFQERWDEALSVDPDFIYLNDWNEWTAGKYRNGKDPSGQADLQVHFLGRKDNPFYFVDQYNAEFNRTISPMKGGYTDNYYMQMVRNVRRYKGVRDIPVNRSFNHMAIDGNFDDWKAVEVEYRDTYGDVVHRSHDGYGDNHYVNTSGRNDILTSKVAMDRDNVFFYVETAEELTPDAGDNWMLLFLDADSEPSTGWNGYDILINRKVSDGISSLMRYNSRKACWEEDRDAVVRYARSGNRLELSVPRRSLGIKTKRSVKFDFKWSDNPSSIEDIISICTDGDTAPNRRFNYRYLWRK